EGALAFLHLREDDSGILTGVGDDLTQRLFDRARQDLDAEVLILVRAFQLLDSLLRTDQRNAAARDHAFLDGRTSGMQRVFDAGLLLLHLDLGRSTDLDHGDAAGELRNALLQLLLVVVARGVFD